MWIWIPTLFIYSLSWRYLSKWHIDYFCTKCPNNAVTSRKASVITDCICADGFQSAGPGQECTGMVLQQLTITAILFIFNSMEATQKIITRIWQCLRFTLLVRMQRLHWKICFYRYKWMFRGQPMSTGMYQSWGFISMWLSTWMDSRWSSKWEPNRLCQWVLFKLCSWTQN